MISLFEYFRLGGIFMYPLLICSIIGLTVILERLIIIHKSRINVKKFMNNLIEKLKTEGIEASCKVCKENKGLIAKIIYVGLKQSHKGIDKVEKFIESTSTVEISLLEIIQIQN